MKTRSEKEGARSLAPSSFFHASRAERHHAPGGDGRTRHRDNTNRGKTLALGAGLPTTAVNISLSAALLGAAPAEPAGPQPPRGLGRTTRGGWGRARRAMPPGVPRPNRPKPLVPMVVADSEDVHRSGLPTPPATDRGSPVGVGELRSAQWQVLETLPQRSLVKVLC